MVPLVVMNSSTLIFSDTHLTHLADERKLKFLLRIAKEPGQIIINGDFWDSYLTTAERFVNSAAWQPLFDLLTPKTLYLYGNHDPQTVCQGLEKRFCALAQEQYDFIQGAQAFHVEHGNVIAPEVDTLFPWIPRPLLGLGSHIDNMCTELFGERFLKRYQHWNEKMKEWQNNNLDSTTYLICGHSHFAELSPPFANSGSIRGGLGSYLLIQDGKVELKTERY